jgi:hypothetical protein
MHLGKSLLLYGVVTVLAVVNMSTVEAQLRRRSSLLRSRPVRRSAATKEGVSIPSQNRTLVISKIIQLKPNFSPANGPEGSQGIAYIYYDDEATLLNSGRIVSSGLAEGEYYAWLVFIDLLSEQKIFSELVAEFQVSQTSNRTEVGLTFGSPEVIKISNVKQLVITKKFQTPAELGKEPVAGAAGYPGGPGNGEAVLAANITAEMNRVDKAAGRKAVEGRSNRQYRRRL